MGGSQVAYRVASARQELHIDHRANLQNAMERSEFLQAECEELALTLRQEEPNSSDRALRAKRERVGTGAPRQDVRRVTNASFRSWDGLFKQDRCFVCSGEGHFSKDCPTKKDREKTSSSTKAAKLKPTKENGATAEDAGKTEEPAVKKLDDAKPKSTSSKTSRLRSLRIRWRRMRRSQAAQIQLEIF